MNSPSHKNVGPPILLIDIIETQKYPSDLPPAILEPEPKEGELLCFPSGETHLPTRTRRPGKDKNHWWLAVPRQRGENKVFMNIFTHHATGSVLGLGRSHRAMFMELCLGLTSHSVVPYVTLGETLTCTGFSALNQKAKPTGLPPWLQYHRWSIKSLTWQTFVRTLRQTVC